MFRKISYCVYIVFSFLVIHCQQLGASTIYKWQNHDLAISLSSPPALIFIQDAQNNMSGADPSKGLDSYGEGSIIQEIPTSFVHQENSVSDAINGVNIPSATTGWSIDIMDHPTETYTINLQGLATGVSDISITALYAISLNIPQFGNEMEIFNSKGVTRQISVTFNPISRSLTSTPIVNSGDLLQDTKIACSLDDISPPEACEVLEALATEIEKAVSDGNTQIEAIELKVYLIILNRLHNWGRKGYRHNWDDLRVYPECTPLCNKDRDHTIFFAKDPSYSALKLDAETLLNALPK